MLSFDNKNLKRRFSDLTFDSEKGLPSARLVQNGAGVEVFLQGAHVSRYDARDGASPLFMSRQAVFDTGKPIRGGIPICFPWFGPKKGDPEAPAHGFARTTSWDLSASNNAGVRFSLQSNPDTLQLWPHAFEANYRVGLFGGALHLGFEVQNTGDAPFDFEIALHTYFRVSDIRSIEIEGLRGKTYLDKVDDGARKTQTAALYIEGETDRVYFDSPGPITLRDEGRTTRIIGKSGWLSTVVWNPWIEKAHALKDLGSDEWTQFVCIEAGAVADNAVHLEVGQNYELKLEIEVESVT